MCKKVAPVEGKMRKKRLKWFRDVQQTPISAIFLGSDKIIVNGTMRNRSKHNDGNN